MGRRINRHEKTTLHRTQYPSPLPSLPQIRQKSLLLPGVLEGLPHQLNHDLQNQRVLRLQQNPHQGNRRPRGTHPFTQEN